MIMSNSTYNQLTANLELLKLTQMKLHLDEIRDFVTTNGLSFTEGLLKLSNYEVDFKEQNASRSMIKAAAFPFVKELKVPLFFKCYGASTDILVCQVEDLIVAKSQKHP